MPSSIEVSVERKKRLVSKHLMLPNYVPNSHSALDKVQVRKSSILEREVVDTSIYNVSNQWAEKITLCNGSKFGYLVR